MILSKSRVTAKEPSDQGSGKKQKKLPDLDEFLANRDYAGAITLLNYRRRANEKDAKNLEWLAYAYYHFGEHAKALAIYQQLLEDEESDPMYYIYAAACYYYMGLYAKAEELATKGPRCGLATRVLFHCAHRSGDEAKLMQQHQALSDSLEDQLSLAAVHYLRSHYQEATDIYKRLLLEHREHAALNVYVALCYCKLDYYDVSLDILAAYLAQHPDSALAGNLRACNVFRLYNGKAAEAELKALEQHSSSYRDNDLVRHNLVVFRSGEGALQVLPGLMGMAAEARLNLAIYHMRHDDVRAAYELLKDLEPATPQEYYLRGMVHAAMGQGGGGQQYLKVAQQCFQLVGSSASECDTIPGRQCMASCFFLLKQFEDVLVYLKSIRTYFPADDDFNWNYGTAAAAAGEWRDGEEALRAVAGERLRNDPLLLSWLAKCHIMTGKPRLAWDLYLRMDASDASFTMLQMIANECYKQGAFLWAAKAFDTLERLDPTPEHWLGKQGAAVGTLQMVAAGREPPESLREIVMMLMNSNHPNAPVIVRVIQKWGVDNGAFL